jgi:hypothetical protein
MRWSFRALVTSALLAVAACNPASRRVQPMETTAAMSAPLGRTRQQERVVITRAAIEIEVEKVAPAAEQATRLAQVFEGYVENATTREDKSA